MALNSSGQISMGGSTTGESINLELGYGATATISLNDTAIRNLAGIASGAIDMNTFHGKSSAIISNVIISGHTTNYTLNPSVCPGYSAGKTTVNLTVNSGIWLYSTSTSTPALTVSGFTSGDVVNIINNGYIAGMGGNGGNDSNKAGTPGGNSISLSYPVKITNNSYIGGGGGGGGGKTYATGGGGAGGGAGGAAAGGGAGGAINSAGSNGTAGSYTSNTGGGGGRIFPGTGGASKVLTAVGYQGGNGGGSGGGGAAVIQVIGPQHSPCGGAPSFLSTGGGGGGGWGASGGSGTYAGICGTPYTTTGAQGGSNGSIGANATIGGTSGSVMTGSAGGKAIALNGYSVTWLTTGTVYGAVS